MIEKIQDQDLREVRFELPLDKPLTVVKKSKPPKDKQIAKKIVLKSVDEKEVNLLYNAKIDSLKIKCGGCKVAYSYNDLPSEIKAYYQNTQLLYDSFKTKNYKIEVNSHTKTLIFHDKRKPKPPSPQPQIIDEKLYLQSVADGVIQDLESSTQILSLVKGPHRSLLADHYVTLGKENLRYKLYNIAKEYLSMAIKIYGQLHLSKSEQCAKAHHQLGSLHILQGYKEDKYEFDGILPLSDHQIRAIDEFKAALEILSSIKNSNLAQIKALVLNSLGLVYSQYDHQQAKEYFLEALSHAQKFDKQSNVYFEASLNLGKLHNRMKDFDQAYKDLSEYLKMISSVPQFQRKSFKIQCELSKACLELKKYKEGLEIINSLTIFSQLVDTSLIEVVEKIQARWASRLLNLSLFEAYDIILNLQAFLRMLQEYSSYKKSRIFSITNRLATLRRQ